MKKSVLTFISSFCSVLLLISCNNNSSKTETINTDTIKHASADTTIMAVDTSTAKLKGTMNEFVTKASEGGMMEVAMGKLAETNGGSPDIKEYGKMLEKDHGMDNADLQGIAVAERIQMSPGLKEDQTRYLKDLEAKRGANFDKTFIDMMIEDHTKDIEEFKAAAANNENEKVRAFAAKTLPVLQKHLDKAREIKGKMK